MRVALAVVIFASWVGCGPGSRLADAPPTGGDAGPADAPVDAEPCEGLACQVVRCEDQGRPATTISGTVYAPNGKLELFGVNVYVPNKDPGPFIDGAQCTKCNDGLPGFPIAKGISNEFGRFTVTGAPSGTNIPLVITIGKWRRQVVLPEVRECTDNPVSAAFTTLPKNKSEGDLPKIALISAGCDALECLIRKLGIDDSEYTNDVGTGRIHMYTAGGATAFPDGTPYKSAASLWGNLDKLKEYDIVMNACECSRNGASKPFATMKEYADAGGRVFNSHYGSVWVAGDTNSSWPTVASCATDVFHEGPLTIDQDENPKGKSFALWLQYVLAGSNPIPGVIPLESGTGRQTCTTVDTAIAERWVYLDQGANKVPQNFQFTTPIEKPEQERCGKVVVSDMHVVTSSIQPFPNGCNTTELTPQETALAFMFFDIASCVGVIN